MPLVEEERQAEFAIVDPTQFESETARIFWESAASCHHRAAKLARPDQMWKQEIRDAIQLIQTDLPANYEAFQKTIDYICPIAAADFYSASHPHFFGTLFLARNNDPSKLAVSIVHELAHQELFLLNLLDRLITESSDYNLAHAPYQGTQRPPIGRLHSAHALYRMIPFEQKLKLNDTSVHREKLDETIRSFTPNETTPFAKRLIHEIYPQVLGDSHLSHHGRTYESK
jgi:HEXXH motif-containing protein